MAHARVSLHDRRVVFDEAEDEATSFVPTMAGLRFTAQFSGGRKQSVDLTDYPISGIAAVAATILWEETQPGGAIRSPGVLDQITQSLSRLAEFLAIHRRGQTIRTVRDLVPADVDAFEDYLRRRYGATSNMPWIRLQALRQFLDLCLSRGHAGEAIRPRLAFVSKGGKRKSTPRDAYSPFVAQQLREGAKKDIMEAIERITVQGTAFIAEGRDPAVHGWQSPQNIAWHLAHRGLVGSAHNNIHNHFKNLSYRLSNVILYVHSGMDDLLPFMVLVSLETGLPIECVRALRKDCIRNERGGYADLCYIKRRRGIETEKVKSVRLDALFSPGWLVKTVLRLTEQTRNQIGAELHDKLFIGWSQTKGLTVCTASNTGKLKNSVVERFTERHGIVDDAGKPMHGFVPARLRKTAKSEHYIKVNGHLADAVDDNSKEVYIQHYAKIPALEPLHEATVAAGLQAALDAAYTPIVLDAEAEARMRADPAEAAVEWNRPQDQVAGVADGSADVWLAGCLDYRHSPYGEPDKVCPIPVWGCLECSNAVITSSKLPAILAFLDHILSKRQQMSLSTWSERFGRAHRRITEQILPRFPAREIAMAKAVAESDGHLVWLPAELTKAP